MKALGIYRDARQLSRDVHQPDDEASALEGIAEGGAHLTRALEIFTRLGMTPDQSRVQGRLADLTSETPQP